MGHGDIESSSPIVPLPTNGGEQSSASLVSGYNRFTAVQRVSLSSSYVYDLDTSTTGIFRRPFTDDDDAIFFTLLNDRDGRVINAALT